MDITKEKMPETMYRASRFCRVLGNPTAYLILSFLRDRSATVTELSAGLGITIATVSATLRHLRNIDTVRYLTVGNEKAYWIKDKKVVESMDVIESNVDAMREKWL